MGDSTGTDAQEPVNEAPSESMALTVTLNEPVAAGVPEITPVDETSARGDGSDDEADTIENVTSPTPPVWDDSTANDAAYPTSRFVGHVTVKKSAARGRVRHR